MRTGIRTYSNYHDCYVDIDVILDIDVSNDYGVGEVNDIAFHVEVEARSGEAETPFIQFDITALEAAQLVECLQKGIAAVQTANFHKPSEQK
jgi:hypothetical protein